MKIFQKGFNYSQDGQGNRLVYHLQGCNLKCPWCANPEGMEMEGTLIADEEWLLDEICPHGAIKEKVVNRAVCADCKTRECIQEHNTKGMYLSYTEMSTDEVVSEIQNNEMMFYDGGGVTFTGGEATLQFAELWEVLKRVKEQGIHTAIETNGSHVGLPKLFPYLDQLIIDCKLMDGKKHEKIMGVGNEVILDNIRQAAKVHPKLHVRVPLIGGVNDSETDQQEFLAFFQEIDGENVTFEVLSYHEFGKKKWEQCGWSYQMTQDAYVKDETLLNFRKKIQEAGLNYQRT